MQTWKSCTCYAQENTSKWNPSIFTRLAKEFDDIVWRECKQNSGVPVDNIIETNGENRNQPQDNYWSKQDADLMGTRVLQRK